MACWPVAAVILAAGEASRMGQLKQLLPFGKTTLLGNTMTQARAAGFDPVVVVTGAESASVRAAIAAERVHIVENPAWKRGMGSSIAAGVRELRETGNDAGAVAILLADQPLVTAQHFRAMRTALVGASASAVAAEYGGTLGVPAIFRRELWSDLIALPPEVGAKQLLCDRGTLVIPFPLPEAATDIDTTDDYERLGIGGDH